MRGRRQASAGFTLLELMIALGLVAIVTTQVLGVFSSQQQQAFAQKRVVEVQEDVRLVVDMMLSDLRMAGFMVPRLAGVAGVDGGTGGPDIVCASDPSVISATILADASSRFSGASLATTLGDDSTQVSLVEADMDIDGDGNDDFAAGAGLIVSDGTDNHCARILSIASGTVTFTPKTPAGFDAATPGARAVPAVVYEVTTQGVTRNSQLLAVGVEDIQVEFGVDANDDGQLAGGEFPIHGLNGSNAALVRTVRLSVITKTSQEDDLSGPGLQAAANRNAAGAPDSFRRRRVTVTTAPRNLL